MIRRILVAIVVMTMIAAASAQGTPPTLVREHRIWD
jgi:hypothetical protein